MKFEREFWKPGGELAGLAVKRRGNADSFIDVQGRSVSFRTPVGTNDYQRFTINELEKIVERMRRLCDELLVEKENRRLKT